MGTCITEAKLIRLVGGEISPSERDTLEAHLEVCTDCREHHRALQQTWTLLGQWQPEIPSSDLAARVLTVAPSRRRHLQWLPLAASVAVAIGLGGVIGSYSSPDRMNPPRAAAVSTEQLAHSLGLEALSEEGITLGDMFAPDEGAVDDEELHS